MKKQPCTSLMSIMKKPALFFLFCSCFAFQKNAYCQFSNREKENNSEKIATTTKYKTTLWSLPESDTEGNSEIIEIPYKSKVAIIDYALGYFWKINYGNNIGFVSSSYLETTDQMDKLREAKLAEICPEAYNKALSYSDRDSLEKFIERYFECPQIADAQKNISPQKSKNEFTDIKEDKTEESTGAEEPQAIDPEEVERQKAIDANSYHQYAQFLYLFPYGKHKEEIKAKQINLVDSKKVSSKVFHAQTSQLVKKNSAIKSCNSEVWFRNTSSEKCPSFECSFDASFVTTQPQYMSFSGFSSLPNADIFTPGAIHIFSGNFCFAANRSAMDIFVSSNISASGKAVVDPDGKIGNTNFRETGKCLLRKGKTYSPYFYIYGDPNNALTLLVTNAGYIYISGKGTFNDKNGKTISFK